MKEKDEIENKKSRDPIELKFINVLISVIISIIILLALIFIIIMQYEKNNKLNSEVARLNYQIETNRNAVSNNIGPKIEKEIEENNTEEQQKETDTSINKEENTEKINNSVSQKNDIDFSDNIVDDIDENGNKIDWEEYPENICKDMEKMGLPDKYGIFLLDDYNDDNWIKTIWSYYKNGYRDEGFINQYSSGDSTEIIRHESNYPQYNNYCPNSIIYKYSDKIIYEIAALHEDLYVFSNMKGKSEKEQKREQAKMESSYNAKIGETVAYQWNNLKNLKEYNGESVLNNENYYYKIDKMIIMNGYNYSEYWYKTNARAKKIKVIINRDKEYILDLKDTNRVQEFNIDYKQNSVEKPVKIEIEVLEKYNGDLTDDVFISDIQFGITSNIPQGR